jgi:hypothetical protein
MIPLGELLMTYDGRRDQNRPRNTSESARKVAPNSDSIKRDSADEYRRSIEKINRSKDSEIEKALRSKKS